MPSSRLSTSAPFLEDPDSGTSPDESPDSGELFFPLVGSSGSASRAAEVGPGVGDGVWWTGAAEVGPGLDDGVWWTGAAAGLDD